MYTLGQNINCVSPACFPTKKNTLILCWSFKLKLKVAKSNFVWKTMRFVFGEGGLQCGVAFFVVLWLVSDWGRNLNIYHDKTVHRNYNSNWIISDKFTKMFKFKKCRMCHYINLGLSYIPGQAVKIRSNGLMKLRYLMYRCTHTALKFLTFNNTWSLLLLFFYIDSS